MLRHTLMIFTATLIAGASSSISHAQTTTGACGTGKKGNKCAAVSHQAGHKVKTVKLPPVAGLGHVVHTMGTGSLGASLITGSSMVTSPSGSFDYYYIQPVRPGLSAATMRNHSHQRPFPQSLAQRIPGLLNPDGATLTADHAARGWLRIAVARPGLAATSTPQVVQAPNLQPTTTGIQTGATPQQVPTPTPTTTQQAPTLAPTQRVPGQTTPPQVATPMPQTVVAPGLAPSTPVNVVNYYIPPVRPGFSAATMRYHSRQGPFPHSLAQRIPGLLNPDGSLTQNSISLGWQRMSVPTPLAVPGRVPTPTPYATPKLAPQQSAVVVSGDKTHAHDVVELYGSVDGIPHLYEDTHAIKDEQFHLVVIGFKEPE